MSNERIITLLHKSINGSVLSETEQEELNAWISRSAHNRDLYNIIHSEKFSQEVKQMLSYDGKVIWNKISDELPSKKNKVLSIFDNDRFLKYAAVAAILIIVFVTSWFLIIVKNSAESEPVAQEQPVRQDILPAKEGVVLTLSDGRQVALQEVGQGQVAQDGNARLIQSKDGQLSYQLSMEGQSEEIHYNTVSTLRGKQYRILLPDGSKVWLNATSSITYPTTFRGKERNVIISGEAYFEVAKNPAMPFKVAIKDKKTTVEVLGTHFNVSAYADDNSINTTLLEGKVKVSNSRGDVLINPGQQAVSLSDAGSINVLSDVDVEQVMSWKNGLFIFRKAELETIMRQVSRWYGAEVVFEDKIPGSFVAMLPRDVPVSKLLNIIETTGEVKFRVDEETRKIYVRR